MDDGYVSGAPVPGEHTRDVLAELAGLNEEEITALMDSGVVKT
jgi:crotonobetainyl-CoA:carnitine CoA-transferase CaiB-like acyl-CoA transferase